MTALSVRMAELAVTVDPTLELVAMGLGSCIGLVMIDRSRRIAGVAHVVLPGPAASLDQPAKYADTAVPALLTAVVELGARRALLEAAIVGGACMFAVGGGLDIGTRNDAAVRGALAVAGVRLLAHDTGGRRGRTLRVLGAGDQVLVAQVGAPPAILIGPAVRRPLGAPAAGEARR